MGCGEGGESKNCGQRCRSSDKPVTGGGWVGDKEEA